MCKKEIPDNLKFCIFCGEKVEKISLEDLEARLEDKRKKSYEAHVNYKQLNEEHLKSLVPYQKTTNLITGGAAVFLIISLIWGWNDTASDGWTYLFWVGVILAYFAKSRRKKIRDIPDKVEKAKQTADRLGKEYRDAQEAYQKAGGHVE